MKIEWGSLGATWTTVMSKFALPHMIATGSGSIINCASGWGLVGGAKAVAYCAAKGGMVVMTKAMAIDHGRQGIRVNAVCPGDTDTPMERDDSRAQGLEWDDYVEMVVGGQPIERLAVHQIGAHQAGKAQRTGDRFLPGLRQAQQQKGDQRDGDLDLDGILAGPEEAGDAQHLLDPDERQVIARDRDEHFVDHGERVLVEQRERRPAVDDHELIASAQRHQPFGEHPIATRFTLCEINLGGGQSGVAGDDVEVTAHRDRDLLPGRVADNQMVGGALTVNAE